jgi:predicted transcriptional regulator of viral defense system
MAPTDRDPDAPAGEEWRFTSEGSKSNAKLRLAAVARRQFGRARYGQIRAIGVGVATISGWCDSGYLHWELPGVYAVGHPGRTTESDLAAAILYAGPGAMLSHATAAWWLALLKYPPRQIHVSSPRRVQSTGDIVVHGRRDLTRIEHRGLPVTTPSQAILDFAATGPKRLLRFVLANADYHDLLDVRTLQAISGQGIPGTAALNEALTIHLPALAHTRGTYEIVLVEFCETYDFPIPQTNVYVHGWLVDAYWPDYRLVVEIDDWRGHRTPAQLHSNHQRDLELRAAGLQTLRYAGEQLTGTPKAVVDDLSRYLPRLPRSC